MLVANFDVHLFEHTFGTHLIFAEFALLFCETSLLCVETFDGFGERLLTLGKLCYLLFENSDTFFVFL